ncbi:MAG TPA: hypothetical protein VGF30_05735 [Bacteroidia bacterium]
MSSIDKTSREKKLAGIITGLVSLTFLTSVFFIKIVSPAREIFNAPLQTSSVEIPVDLAFQDEQPALNATEDKSSLSNSLPAGISQSIVKIETELFKNSFTHSIIPTSNNLPGSNSETPEKAPSQSIGGSKPAPAGENTPGTIGGNLKNRKLVFIENISGANNEGVVVVKTTVNANGDVITAEIDPERTTASSTSLRSKALKTAQGAVFEKTSTSEDQTGFITFKFEF